VFFGAPYTGLRTIELEKAIRDINSRMAVKDQEEEKWRADILDLIRQLSPGSDYLEQLRNDVTRMAGVIGNRPIISFCENARTHTARIVSAIALAGSLLTFQY
jgi:hypothetical protein